MERMAQRGNIEMSQAFYMEIWNGYERSRELEEENEKLKEKLSEITMVADDEKQSIEHILELEEENKKLKEFKEKREESMFYFKAQMERAEPKTAREAEDLQRAKELFEKLYREELSCLEEENKKLKEENEKLRIDRELDKGNTIFGM